MERAIRTVFFGTPEFAVPCFKILFEPELSELIDVVAVVTQPDRPMGRRQVLTPPPVKVAAQRRSLPVLQPSSIRQKTVDGRNFHASFKALSVDLAVVVAYGNIIPAELLQIPGYGFVNVHPSILPRWRGATPIQAALLAGDSVTGVTIMQMDEGMDTGPVLLTVKTAVEENETAGRLHDRLARKGAEALREALLGYLAGTLSPTPQSQEGVTSCGLISKEDGRIDWSRPAEEIERQIRAMQPWPGAFTEVYKQRVLITRAHLEGGRLVVDEVKPAGRTTMSYAEYLNGNGDSPLPPASERSV